MTYCATTASKTESANAQVLGVHHRQRFDIGKTHRAHALLRLAQHRLGNIDRRTVSWCAIISTAISPCRRRRRGNAAADLVGLRDGGLAAVIEHLAEHEMP